MVFGMLGCLAALAQTPVPEGQRPASLGVDFKGPLLLNVDYGVTVKEERSGGLRVALMDGSVTAVVMRLKFEHGTPAVAALAERGSAPRSEARLLQTADLTPGLSFRGAYSADGSAYTELLDRQGVKRAEWGDALLLTLLASSYLTGMELPGESAAFVGLKAEFPATAPHARSQFEIALESYDERFGLVESRFSLAGESDAYARGEITALARPSRARTELASLEKGSKRFEGKTAVVIGASRGLGSALTLQLVADGCTVMGVYAKSRDAAEEMAQASQSLPGRLIMEQGDPSDVDWCVVLRDRVKEEFGRLDVLICSAAPSLQNLKFEEAVLRPYRFVFAARLRAGRCSAFRLSGVAFSFKGQSALNFFERGRRTARGVASLCSSQDRCRGISANRRRSESTDWIFDCAPWEASHGYDEYAGGVDGCGGTGGGCAAAPGAACHERGGGSGALQPLIA